MEEFISRLVRHIPDEQFKTIRYYGVYSRRIKGMCKKLVSVWQKEVRKWIVKAKRVLNRRTWAEKVREKTGKDPMVCPKCECYYEYKGEVCLENGQLVVKYAACANTRAVLERMIRRVTGIEETEAREEKEEKSTKKQPAEQGSSELYMFAV